MKKAAELPFDLSSKGLNTSQTTGGWHCTYSYKTAGAFDLTIVVTNHGYNGPDYQQVVVSGGKITVK